MISRFESRSAADGVIFTPESRNCILNFKVKILHWKDCDKSDTAIERSIDLRMTRKREDPRDGGARPLGPAFNPREIILCSNAIFCIQSSRLSSRVFLLLFFPLLPYASVKIIHPSNSLLFP